MSFGNRYHRSDLGWARHCGWLVAVVLLLGGCGKDSKKAEGPAGSASQSSASGATITLEQSKKYAVYYYDSTNKVVLVESLNSPQGRTVTAPTGSEPALAAVCDPSFPSKPANCQGNRCPVSAMAASAVYYGIGSETETSIKVVGIEKGPFDARMVDWDGGTGCAPACPKRCCAPVTGGCRCMC